MPNIVSSSAVTTAAYGMEWEFYTLGGLPVSDLPSMTLRLRFWEDETKVESAPYFTLTSPASGLTATGNVLKVSITAAQMALFKPLLVTKTVAYPYFRLDRTDRGDPELIYEDLLRVRR